METRVRKIMENVGQKPRIVDCCRLRKKTEGSVRPVKVTLSSSYIVAQVLRNSKLLKIAEGCRQIFIFPDRSVEQRKAQKELVDQLRKFKTEHPNVTNYIKNGKVVARP